MERLSEAVAEVRSGRRDRAVVRIHDPVLGHGERDVEIARVAARTVTAAIRVTSGERALSVGIIGCLQTHGSRANWHPHIHMIVTDGGCRSDGTFVHWPTHDPGRLAEAFRRAVLRLCVRRELLCRDRPGHLPLGEDRGADRRQ